MNDRVPDGVIDFTRPDFRLDPVSGYNELRRASAICYQPSARGFLVTAFAEAAEALRDPALDEPDYAIGWRKIAVQLGTDFHSAMRLFDYAPFLYEGARHQRLRTTLARAVAPFANDRHRFEQRVDKLLANVRHKGAFDLVQDFAGVLFFEVLCDLMEFPEEERNEVRPLAHLSMVIEATLPVRLRKVKSKILADGIVVLKRHVRRVLAQPGSSLIHALASARPNDETDVEDAVAHFCAVMLVMGNDALGGCISFAVRRLLDDDAPARDRVAQSDWARISDDAIRFSSPVDLLTRIAHADTMIAKVPIRRGETVYVSPTAANHDPLAFGEDAGCIRPRSKVGTGLAFGAGRHLCIGALLSRNIVHVAFRKLADLPALRADGAAQPGPGQIIRTLASLPVRLS